MNPRDLIDDLLEITVVGSFTSPGFRLRRRLFDWQPPPADALRGRTALVTGPTSGLGRVIAGELAALGARVVLVGRSRDRLAEVSAELTGTHGEDRFPTVVADLSTLASVGGAADEILAREPRLDVFVDNAGAIFPERTETPDGIEATLATMVVGPFVLIGRLLPLLDRTAGRVISVTSGGMYTQAVDPDDLQWRGGEFSGPRAYARAKRIQVAIIREWARRRPGPVTFNAMHPGWADTPGLRDQLPAFHSLMQPLLRSPEEGVDTIVWLATDPIGGAVSGRLWLDRRPRPFDRVPATRLTPDMRARLWERIVALSGEPDPAPADQQRGAAPRPPRVRARVRPDDRATRDARLGD